MVELPDFFACFGDGTRTFLLGFSVLITTPFDIEVDGGGIDAAFWDVVEAGFVALLSASTLLVTFLMLVTGT